MTTTTTTTSGGSSGGTRERGTPRGALTRRVPLLLIVIANASCVALALLTALLHSSSSSSSSSSTSSTPDYYGASVTRLGFVAFLGSASTSIGIVFCDSISHVFAFGLAMLFVAIDDGLPIALAASSPPLILAALSSFGGAPRRIISSSFDHPHRASSAACRRRLIIAIRSCCVVPLAMAMHASMSTMSTTNYDKEEGGGGIIIVIFACIATLLLMHAYHGNRAHKNGCLLVPEMISEAMYAGGAMFLSISIAMSSSSSSSGGGDSGPSSRVKASVVIAFLLGSLFLTLLCHALASIADAWYAVGSGQFHMISLDTVGMMLYFVLPAGILQMRFLDMYAGRVASMWTVVAGGYSRFVDGVVLPSSAVGDSLPLCIAMTLVATSSVVGVPLLNSLCPLGGYLYSRAYTHGRPNTGRVALCVNFRDLPKDGRGRDDVMDALRKRNKTDDRTAAAAAAAAAAVLNVFVTSEDIARFPNELKAIAGRGHAIGLTLAESDEGSFCRPSIFGGGRAVRDLRIAHREYARLFGEGDGPSWMLSRSASSMGRHPSVLREASDLGMKVAYWSTLVMLTTDRLTSEQRIAISGDCSDKNGGSILYVTLGKGVSSNSVSGSLCGLIDTLDGRYSLESLSDVARDDVEMVLKR